MTQVTQKNLLLIGDAAIRNKDGQVDLVSHHKDGYNSLMTRGGLAHILKEGYKIENQIQSTYALTDEDKKIKTIYFRYDFTKVSINKPKDENRWELKNTVLLPKTAQDFDRTYAGTFMIDIKVTFKAYDDKDNLIKERNEEIHDLEIAKIPIMVRSECCNTYGKTKQQLIEMGENYTDQGGYFIINGNRYIIKNMESVRFNHPRRFLNIGHKNEFTRLEYISRPGDKFENSAQLIVRLLTSGALTCEISIEKSRNKFKEVPLPFYLLFRALGVSTDKDIFTYIMRGASGEIGTQLLELLQKAMHAKYSHFKDAKLIRDPDDARKLIYNRTKDDYLLNKTDTSKAPEYAADKLMKITNDFILGVLDTHLLPHIGNRPEDRPKKIKHLGYLINHMLMLIVKPNLIKSTDRDAYDTKRVADAGTCLSKIFKKGISPAIGQPLKTGTKKALTHASFNDINIKNLVENLIRRTELGKSIIRSIISGSKTVSIRQQNLTYRIVSQQLHQKNQLNVISALRDIETPETTSAGKDVRSDEMRRVHVTFLGYVCFIQSADSGKRVGMAKQMAITATLCGFGEMDILKNKLLQDPDVIPHDNIPVSEIEVRNVSEIFVNGYPLGFTENAPALVDKYRKYRRNQLGKDLRKVIHPHTSIYYNSVEDAIYFDVDYGRIIRPLLIVERDPKTGIQDIKVTPKHIDKLLLKEINFTDLLNDGIVEYIAPEEHLNCMIASSLNVLRDDKKSSLVDYTHCEIPQNLMGVPALTSPYSNSNQAPRNVFQTQQVKQTCGWVDWVNYIEKNTFVQFRNETPLLRTISNRYLMPNGSNIYLCILTYGGWNQEDSWIFNKSSIERGLFLGMHFNMERTELKKDEEFRIPDETYTKDVPRHVSYDKLDERGFIREGSIVEKNDVLIGKLYKIHKPTDNYTHVDKSLVYKYNEPAYITKVITGHNDEDHKFCKVIFGAIRPPDIGDKFCLLPNTEVLTLSPTGGKLWIPIKDITIEHNVATLKERYQNRMQTYDIEYNHPTELYEFDHNGPMYQSFTVGAVNGEGGISQLTTTLNHKMYIKHGQQDIYRLWPAYSIVKKDVIYLNYNMEDMQTYKEDIIPYTGKVYCFNVPNHIFLVRETPTSIPIWTGNSARSGQKGVIGMVYSAADMPTTESGIIPDIIMNPHAYPTRMTINQDQELLTGRLAAHRGVIGDATCFTETDMDAVNTELVKLGYDPWGEDRMYNGMTGEFIDVKVYSGPCYYQRLQKFVIDEVYAAASGVTCALTRQPVAGKSKHGGLRIGEMEKDVLCAHGSMRTLLSKFTTDSDEFDIYVCRGCGKMPIVNLREGYYNCHTCNDLADIYKVPTKWASKLFMQELNSMGIGTKFYLRPFTYERI